MTLERNRECKDVVDERGPPSRLVRPVSGNTARRMHDHADELGGAGEHADPGLAALVEARVGGLGAEDEEERERGGRELVGQRGRRERVCRDERVVGGHGGGDGGEGGDGRGQGEDDAGGERGEEVPQVAARAPVLPPLLVRVERARVSHPPFRHGVRPVRYGGEQREERVRVWGCGFGGLRLVGEAAGEVEVVVAADGVGCRRVGAAV